MTLEIRPYSEYQDSGLPWLASIPSHWEISRGKNLFNCIDIKSTFGNEELLTVSSKYGVVPRKDIAVTMFKAESYIGYKLCWPGDLVINSLWAWARGLGVSDHHGIISSAYGVYRLKSNNQLVPKYLHELIRSSPYQWELQIRSKGIWTSRLQLTDESFLDAPFLVPPIEEQNAIVKFLDYTDRRIKRYIRAKQKLIKLLNEQKQAIIHQAVTLGLDPNVPLKPSGVEWLGDIPEHWGLRRLKTICKMKSGENITSLQIEDNGEFPVYGGNGLRGYSSRFTHNGRYLLIGRQGALCGNVHFVDGSFWASEHAIVVSIIDKCNLFWFKAVLDKMNLNQYSIAAAQPGLSVERILNLWIPFPSIEEQNTIFSCISGNLQRIDSLLNLTLKQVTLLQQYLTRLIADVVTGKLDVREAAAHLPDELADVEENEAELEMKEEEPGEAEDFAEEEG